MWTELSWLVELRWVDWNVLHLLLPVLLRFRLNFKGISTELIWINLNYDYWLVTPAVSQSGSTMRRLPPRVLPNSDMAISLHGLYGDNITNNLLAAMNCSSCMLISWEGAISGRRDNSGVRLADHLALETAAKTAPCKTEWWWRY